MTRRNRIRFASAAALAFALACPSIRAQANYDCFYVKTSHVAKVQGTVFDQRGDPVRGASVDLFVRGADRPLAHAITESDGAFRFSPPAGPYWLEIKANGFQLARLNLHLDNLLFGLFRPRQVLIVLMASGNTQPCPEDITSKKKLQEYIRDNATKK